MPVGFLGALRGEEVVRLHLGGMRKYWHEGVYNPFTPHVPVILSGRFKKETGIKENKRLLFIVFDVERRLNRSSIFLDEPYLSS